MRVVDTPKLTDRQRAVLERVDQRVPIKVIAADLNVSEARINQHIRALKDKFSVESMSDLVASYRALDLHRGTAETGRNAESKADLNAGLHAGDPRDPDPYRNSLYRKSQLQSPSQSDQKGTRDNPGEIVFSDAHHVLIDAPWMEPREPVVVPPKLDGEHAVLYRIGAMICIAFGIVAALILVVAAAVTISEVLDGKAAIRINQDGSPAASSAGR